MMVWSGGLIGPFFLDMLALNRLLLTSVATNREIQESQLIFQEDGASTCVNG